MFRLDDKVAVITGGGRGLGAAIALAFAQAGADVLIASRTSSELDAVAEQIRAAGRRAHTVAADLAHPEVTAQLAGQAVGAFGKLDIVVNNVGGTMPNTLLSTSTKDLADAFAFNVGTAHALTVAAVPLMLEHSGGGVINISSTMGRLAARGFAAYGTAKAALAHYTRLAALDLCPRVRVNAIAPGSILTSALEVVAANDELRAPMEQATPLRRLGDHVNLRSGDRVDRSRQPRFELVRNWDVSVVPQAALTGADSALQERLHSRANLRVGILRANDFVCR
ncbi:short-chain dehydrogenase/reductase [Mycobacterium tuberculosis]|nr:short-chain dehydrogenase/reductase [Mycobacterium tuberculosis]